MSDNIPQQPRLSYDVYQRERSSWNIVQNEQQKFIDQAVLTLSGGGLGLSVTFLRNYQKAPILLSLLFIGGALLVISMVGVLISLHFSQTAIRKLISALDTAAEQNFPLGAGMFRGTKYVNFSARVTAISNTLSSGCLILGIAFLALFGYCNES